MQDSLRKATIIMRDIAEELFKRKTLIETALAA
jgi:hypothetical protein